MGTPAKLMGEPADISRLQTTFFLSVAKPCKKHDSIYSLNRKSTLLFYREGIYFLRTNAERPFAIPEEKN